MTEDLVYANGNRSMIEGLEPRRLFSGAAVINLTEGDDEVMIFTQFSNNSIHVINPNGIDHISTGPDVTINMLGGNDTVHLLRLERGINVTLNITIDLGGGNDEVNTFDPDDGRALLNNINLGAALIGGAGSDRLVLDDSDGNTVSRQFTMDSDQGDFFIRTSSSSPSTAARFAYQTFEEVEIIHGDSTGARTHLNHKPPSLRTTVFGMGSGDRVIVGGGDIDDSGFRVDDTTIFGGAGHDEIDFDDRLDAESATDIASYQFDNFTFSKGLSGVTYAGFDTQELQTSDVFTGPGHDRGDGQPERLRRSAEHHEGLGRYSQAGHA